MMSTPRSTNHNNNTNNTNNNNSPSNNVDQALNMYIYDYCLKRNYQNAAAAIQLDANLNFADNLIRFDTQEGFLKDWWNCFWNVFHASVSNQPNSDLGVYLEKIRTTSEGNAPPFPFGASPESDSNNTSGVKNTPLQTLASSTQGLNQSNPLIAANQLSGHSPSSNIASAQVKQESVADNSLLKDRQGNIQNSQALSTSGTPQTTTQVRPPTSISLPMNNPMMTAAAWGLQQGQTQQTIPHQMAGVAGRPPQALQNPTTNYDPSSAMRPPGQMPVGMNPAMQYASNPALQSAAIGSNITPQAYMNSNDPNIQANNEQVLQYALIAQHNYRQQLLMQNRQLAHSMNPGQPNAQRPANMTEQQQQELLQRQQHAQRMQQLQQNALHQSGAFAGNPTNAMNINMAMAMRMNPMAQASLQGANMMNMGMNPMQAQQMGQAQNGTPQPPGSAQQPQPPATTGTPNMGNMHASPAPASSVSQPNNIPDLNGGLSDNANNNTSLVDSSNTDSKNVKEDPSDMFNFEKYINMNGSSSPMITNGASTTADLQPPSSVTRDDTGNNLEDFIGNDPFGNAEFF